MKKAIIALHVVFAIFVALGILMYFSESGFMWLVLLMLLALLSEIVCFILQIVSFRRVRTKGAVYQLAVTGILVFVLVLVTAQFFMFTIL